jgi:hypothetical protein
VGNTSGTVSAATTAQIANFSLAASLLGTSSSDAVNNIMEIINGGTASSGSSSTGSSILSLF